MKETKMRVHMRNTFISLGNFFQNDVLTSQRRGSHITSLLFDKKTQKKNRNLICNFLSELKAMTVFLS